MLGIGESALYQQIKRGRIGTIKIGHRRLIPASALRILLAGEVHE